MFAVVVGERVVLEGSCCQSIAKGEVEVKGGKLLVNEI